jgi:hypothetical protein
MKCIDCGIDGSSTAKIFSAGPIVVLYNEQRLYRGFGVRRISDFAMSSAVAAGAHEIARSHRDIALVIPGGS